MASVDTPRPTSFSRAVWQYTWRDFKPGLRERRRLIIQLPVVLAIGWYVLSLWGSGEAPLDFALETLLVIPAGLVAMMLIHLSWSWATAPRRIYADQTTRINTLDNDLTAANKKCDELVGGDRKESQEREGKIALLIKETLEQKQAVVDPKSGPDGQTRYSQERDRFFDEAANVFDPNKEPLMHQKIKAMAGSARQHGRNRGSGCVGINFHACEHFLQSLSSID